jgi:hypothetical protein
MKKSTEKSGKITGRTIEQIENRKITPAFEACRGVA